MATFLLYESASGYALFEAKDMDWVGDTPQSVAETVKYVFFFFVFFFFSDFLFLGRQIFLLLREGKFLFVSPLFLFGYTFTHRVFTKFLPYFLQ